MKRGAIALLISAVAFAAATAETVTGYDTECTGVLLGAIDSIDYRTDLTRVYGRLQGKPHTSGRIDGILMLSGKQRVPMTDLDGVDKKRWFQWEDNSSISIEIDFGVIQQSDSIVFNIDTPRGKSVWRTTKRRTKAKN